MGEMDTPIRTETETRVLKIPILPCPHCGKELRGKAGLVLHIRNKHSDNPTGFARVYKEWKELKDKQANLEAEQPEAQREQTQTKPITEPIKEEPEVKPFIPVLRR